MTRPDLPAVTKTPIDKLTFWTLNTPFKHKSALMR
jgi:hypothetical protein